MVMVSLTPESVIDAKGKVKAVILPKDQYDSLLEYLEDLEDTRVLGLAKASATGVTPARDFLEELSNAKRLGAVAQLRRLFWDKPLEESDFEQYPYWVLARVLDYGQLSDVRAVMALYGREAFYRMVAKVRFSTPKAENFWRQMLEMEGIPCKKKPFPWEVRSIVQAEEGLR